MTFLLAIIAYFILGRTLWTWVLRTAAMETSLVLSCRLSPSLEIIGHCLIGFVLMIGVPIWTIYITTFQSAHQCTRVVQIGTFWGKKSH